jgi:hypothetical protein
MLSLFNRRTILLLCVGFAQWIYLALNAYAGHEVGNGGNAVSCGKTVELLDVYEARVLRGVEFIASGGSDPFALALSRIAILATIDPRSAKLYATFTEKLRGDISFEKELKLGPINDSKHVFVPRDGSCKVRQLAVLRKSVLPGEKAVLIDANLWKKLSTRDKAGLILHEAIYKHLADLDEKTSVNARYFVSLLLSKSFGESSREEYWKAVQAMKLPIYPPAKK